MTWQILNDVASTGRLPTQFEDATPARRTPELGLMCTRAHVLL